MRENTVTLTLGEYNKLRDLEVKLHESNNVYVASRGLHYYCIRESEIVEKLKKDIEDLESKLHEISIVDVKSMSLLEFILWRREK